MLFTCLLKASPKPESDGSRIPHTVRGSLPHFSSAVRVGHLRSREAAVLFGGREPGGRAAAAAEWEGRGSVLAVLAPPWEQTIPPVALV